MYYRRTVVSKVNILWGIERLPIWIIFFIVTWKSRPVRIQSKNIDIQRETEVSTLEKILNNPGLVHLAENILAHEDAEVCRKISEFETKFNIFWIHYLSIKLISFFVYIFFRFPNITHILVLQFWIETIAIHMKFFLPYALEVGAMNS